MNLSELATFVCGKVGTSETNDIAACKGFINRRYELIWHEGLWRDALVMLEMSITPDTDENHAAGIVLLPAEIDRVLACRTTENSLRVNQLEMYHRIDFDRFGQTGTALEFALMSPVFGIFTGLQGLKLATDSTADDGKEVRVNWRASDGVIHNHTRILDYANPPKLTDDASNPPTVTVASAGDANANGTYTWNSVDKFTKDDNSNSWIYWDGGSYWHIHLEEGGDSYKATTLDGTWQYENATSGAIPTVTINNPANITVENVFKPALNGQLSFRAQIDGDAQAELGHLEATDTQGALRQRLRLFSKPTQATTLRVLGKRKFSSMAQDYESPQMQNVDNCLIAFAHADMLQRMRQYGKAQVIAQEAAALLNQLKQIELVHQATNQRIIPDGGFQPDYEFGYFRAF